MTIRKAALFVLHLEIGRAAVCAQLCGNLHLGDSIIGTGAVASHASGEGYLGI